MTVREAIEKAKTLAACGGPIECGLSQALADVLRLLPRDFARQEVGAPSGECPGYARGGRGKFCCDRRGVRLPRR
jgi:hypothetical protein